MQLTQNFSLEEFACRDGSSVPVPLFPNVLQLAGNLQVLRNEIKKPILILSGYRTPSYNQKVGGATHSQHLQAKAADIYVSGYTPKQLHAIIEQLIKEGKMKQGGLGLYKTFVHYDCRGSKARWAFV